MGMSHAPYEIDSVDGAEMVVVPEGDFLMGTVPSDIFANEHEKPQRRVKLSAYRIDICPVTNERYGMFVEAGGYREEKWWTAEGWRWKTETGTELPLGWSSETWNGPTQPVAGVSWYEADAYARWAGKRLPTEAEWEKAARGNDGRTYPWGEEVPSRESVNFHNVVGRTTEVTRYPGGRSPYGCYDMAGNVNNWCQDWYWEGWYRYCIEQGMNRNPCLHDQIKKALGLNLEYKVDRGGGFATDLAYMRVLTCADKVFWTPGTRNYWNGFRTVRDVTVRQTKTESYKSRKD
jgi:formylglycine-generating enzyme required for sulfatase activity